jgi:hypothetical protein
MGQYLLFRRLESASKQASMLSGHTPRVSSVFACDGCWAQSRPHHAFCMVSCDGKPTDLAALRGSGSRGFYTPRCAEHTDLAAASVGQGAPPACWLCRGGFGG